MQSAEQLFESSLKGFRIRLTPKENERLEGVTIENVKVQICKLQNDQDRMRSLMGLSRLWPFLEAFQQFDETCSKANIGGLEQSSQWSPFIWGPCKYILQRANEAPEILDTILDAYENIGKRTPLLRPYESIARESPAIEVCLARMYDGLLQFQGSALRFLTERHWKRTFRDNWKAYDSRFSAILKDFDKLRGLVVNHLDNERFEISTRTNQRLDDHFYRSQRDSQKLQNHIGFCENIQERLHSFIQMYEQDRQIFFQAQAENEEQQMERAFRAVLKWIAAPAGQTEHHEKFFRTWNAIPGIGKWILNEVSVDNLINAEIPTHSMLWINGKMGSGKTVLASLVIEHCLETKSEWNTSYFYCRQEDPRQNTCLAIYKCLLSQLVAHHRELLPSCNEKRLKGTEVLGDTSTARYLLELFWEAQMNQYIIIDGLDECVPAERRAVIEFLSEAVNKCDEYQPGKLRVLFVSQDLDDIRKMMKDAAVFDLRPWHSVTDIAEYVRIKAKDLEDYKITETQMMLAKELTVERSEGMFLFAELVMENLVNQGDTGSLIAELRPDTFPQGLQEAYDRILQRLRKTLPDSSWRKAVKIFGLLACAKRPLRLHELQAAISIQIDDLGEVSFDYHLKQLRKDIRWLCGPLVQVIEGSGIEYIHQTTREHVVKGQGLDIREIECDLAILCVTYLNLRCFRAGANLRWFTFEGHYSFLDYAASKWHHHIESLLTRTVSLFDDPVKGQKYSLKLSIVLAMFVDIYHGGLARKFEGGTVQNVPEGNDFELCRPFEHLPFGNSLTFIWSHICRHQRANFKTRNCISINDLKSSTEKIRETIAELAKQAKKDSTIEETLNKFYGSRHHKCPRTTCDYFYEGFATREEVERHLHRHDRPFHCTVEGCSLVSVGFSSNKDREKHEREYHPQNGSQGDQFPLLRPPAEGEDGPSAPRHRCDECGHAFTRKENLRAHVRSHFGERPFECGTCGRAFTRPYDRERHEKKVHGRRV